MSTASIRLPGLCASTSVLADRTSINQFVALAVAEDLPTGDRRSSGGRQRREPGEYLQLLAKAPDVEPEEPEDRLPQRTRPSRREPARPRHRDSPSLAEQPRYLVAGEGGQGLLVALAVDKTAPPPSVASPIMSLMPWARIASTTAGASDAAQPVRGPEAIVPRAVQKWWQRSSASGRMRTRSAQMQAHLRLWLARPGGGQPPLGGVVHGVKAGGAGGNAGVGHHADARVVEVPCGSLDHLGRDEPLQLPP